MLTQNIFSAKSFRSSNTVREKANLSSLFFCLALSRFFLWPSRRISVVDYIHVVAKSNFWKTIIPPRKPHTEILAGLIWNIIPPSWSKFFLWAGIFDIPSSFFPFAEVIPFLNEWPQWNFNSYRPTIFLRTKKIAGRDWSCGKKRKKFFRSFLVQIRV